MRPWQDGLTDEVVQRWTPPAGISSWGWEPPRGRRVLPAVDPGPGSFAVLQTQPGDDEPVGFSPCGPVPVEVDPAGAPLDHTDLTRWEQHAAVLDHELAHVLGLGHVEDPGELMTAVNTTGRAGFGPGDLAGLATVGAIRCPGE